VGFLDVVPLQLQEVVEEALERQETPSQCLVQVVVLEVDQVHMDQALMPPLEQVLLDKEIMVGKVEIQLLVEVAEDLQLADLMLLVQL
jgi:hypothetical protein